VAAVAKIDAAAATIKSFFILLSKPLDAVQPNVRRNRWVPLFPDRGAGNIRRKSALKIVALSSMGSALPRGDPFSCIRITTVTPRERQDMPWLLTAFAVVIVMIIGGAVFRGSANVNLPGTAFGDGRAVSDC
jgi:hypothetical protein